MKNSQTVTSKLQKSRGVLATNIISYQVLEIIMVTILEIYAFGERARLQVASTIQGL